MDEFAVGNGGFVVEAEKVVDVNGKAVEIDATSEEADDWRDNVVDEGIDDGVEGATDGHTNGEVDNRAAVDEFNEFFADVDIFHVPTMEKTFDFFAFGNVFVHLRFFTHNTP